ncbi:hypothetical protein M433DRAFT_170531 [Acidomyces richmondensis BFW]|nr:MAG: hypothetical protein FE78DRAFT_35601 [Acidomyces sp. 'richmondensis']KYG50438.1 hypothetical protein M433DRAFT_170531 [Acidomyces richmondensis BFW]
MRIKHYGSLLIAATSALALKDASPFFVISSEPLTSDLVQSKQIATSESVEEGILQSTLSCRHALIFFVSQPGTTAEDIQDAKGLPKLKKRSECSKIWSAEIPQVLGTVDINRMAHEIKSTCDTQDVQESYGNSVTPLNVQSAVVRIYLPGINMVAEDDYLDTIIVNATKKTEPYVLFYTSSQQLNIQEQIEQDHPYEMDEPYPSALHTDLKRDLEHHKKSAHTNIVRRQSSSKTVDNAQLNLPLFETYQFFTPGIFMGLIVSLLLFVILYVGVSAIAGLDVSYMAFSKEMGPQAQNKGKQG